MCTLPQSETLSSHNFEKDIPVFQSQPPHDIIVIS